jgi:hypothetical protein
VERWGAVAVYALLCWARRLRMKTEWKYPEPNRIVFCILSNRIRIFVSDFTVFAFVFVFEM